MKQLPKIIGITFLILFNSALNKTVDASDCNTQPKASQALLYSYVKKSGDDPETYSVGGIGNHAYLLDQQMNLILPEDLSNIILRDPRFKTAKRVVLAWPYSAWNNAPYAHALEKILHKPVVGFSGPIWWYPDGVIISSNAEQSTNQKPNESNVAQCMTSDAKYHEGDECKSLLKTHDAAQALFNNLVFVLTCEEVQKLSALEEKGDATASMRLYFYHFFVNIEGDKAALDLSKAALGGNPLANYLVALSMKNKSPPDMNLYLQFLKRAAAGGNKKAIEDLGKIPKN